MCPTLLNTFPRKRPHAAAAAPSLLLVLLMRERTKAIGLRHPVSIIIITTKKSRRYCFWISTRLHNLSRSSRWRITRCQRKTLELNINSTNPAPVAPRTALISTNHIPSTGEKDTAASRVALGPRRAALS